MNYQKERQKVKMMAAQTTLVAIWKFQRVTCSHADEMGFAPLCEFYHRFCIFADSLKLSCICIGNT